MKLHTFRGSSCSSQRSHRYGRHVLFCIAKEAAAVQYTCQLSLIVCFNEHTRTSGSTRVYHPPSERFRTYVALGTTPHPNAHTQQLVCSSRATSPSALDLAFCCRGLSHHRLARIPSVGWAAAPGRNPPIRGWTAVCAEDLRQHG
jgi:hypothetical protein